MNTLLDTNAYMRFITGDTTVSDYILNSETTCFSSVVLGELYAGFYGGNKPDWNINILRDFLENWKFNIKIINVTHATAKIFGAVKNELKQKGRMIPLNDIWIAAHTIETASTLITYDGHFKAISNVKLWPEL